MNKNTKLSPLDLLLNDIESRFQAEDTGKPAEIRTLSKRIVKAIDVFMNASHLLTANRNTLSGFELAPTVSTESLQTSMSQDGLLTLLRSCGVAEGDFPRIAREIALQLSKYTITDSKSAQAKHLQMDTDHVDTVALESFYTPHSIDMFNMSLEGFGVDINVTYPEVAAAVAVPLIRYHLSTADRAFPRLPTSTPTAHYMTPRHEVFSMADAEITPINVTELYQNPDLITNRLRPIVVLDTNDTTGAVVADGILTIGVDANILQLGIDDTDPANTNLNHTDTVADPVKLTSILMSLTGVGAGGSGEETDLVESFTLAVPVTFGQFTRIAGDSADRSITFRYTFRLTNASTTTAGAASTLLAGLDEGEAVVVSVFFAGTINLQTGLITATSAIRVAAGAVTGADASVALTQLMEDYACVGAAVGYSIDARYSEENMRKSHLVVRQQRKHFEWNIGTGRNVLYDTPLADAQSDDTASNMISGLLNLGNDATSLSAFRDVISGVAAGLDNVEAGTMTYSAFSNLFVAGNRVRPMVIEDTFDPSLVTRMRDADTQGDIRGRFDAYLTGIVTQLIVRSFLQTQLPAGTRPTFRCVCGPKVLGRLFACHQIHQHLDNGSFDSAGGVEYKMVLQDGTTLEIVTTTFEAYEEALMMVAHIPGDPKSDLNFGHIWDHGSYFLSYTPSVMGYGQWKRLAGNSRFLPIPTNPVGAFITFANLDSISPLAVGQV